MNKPSSLPLFLLLLCCGAAPALSQEPQAKLQVVLQLPKLQATGIAVSRKNRLFLCFPDWSDDHTFSVAELLKDGTLKPYPNEAWNASNGPPENRLVCVQSVYIDNQDALWILDPASPKMEGVVKGGPKLLKVNLATNQVVQTIAFPDEIAPQRSYLNDVRVDANRGYAFITESGIGSLIVVNLKTGNIRRVLVDAPETKAEPGMKLIVGGIELIDPKTNSTPAINADGLALDTRTGWVYFHALAAHTLYKIATEDLTNPDLSSEALAARVIRVTHTPAPDGMLADSTGRVYLTDLEHNAILRWDPPTNSLEQIIQDDRLQWPDSMSWGPGGELYITASQIHLSPRFNHGVSKRTEPYGIFRIQVPK